MPQFCLPFPAKAGGSSKAQLLCPYNGVALGGGGVVVSMETPTSASGYQKCQRRHLGGKKKRGPQKEQDSLTGSGGSSAWGSGSQGWAWDEVICQLSGPQKASLFPRSLFPSRVPALIPFPWGLPQAQPRPQGLRASELGGKGQKKGGVQYQACRREEPFPT